MSPIPTGAEVSAIRLNKFLPAQNTFPRECHRNIMNTIHNTKKDFLICEQLDQQYVDYLHHIGHETLHNTITRETTIFLNVKHDEQRMKPTPVVKERYINAGSISIPYYF